MIKEDSLDTLLRQLKNPFDPKFVKWRVGATSQDKKKGIALAYIDSREVMKRFDEVVGIEKWQSRYSGIEKGFICEIGLLINGEWVWKSNAADYTQVAPIKGGASDAFKRAATAWGVGRYLYYLPNTWVSIKEQGKSYVLAEVPELPDWAKPSVLIENWEDLAEMEAELNSGADSELIEDTAMDSLDLLTSATTQEELDIAIESMTEKEQILLTNEIAIKRRALNHGTNISASHSQSSAA